MNPHALLVNDRPLTDLVRAILAVDGYLSPIVPQRERLPLAAGPAVWGSGVTVAPRGITAYLDARPGTLIERTELIDALRRRIPSLSELRMADLPGRVCFAGLTAIDVQFYTGAHANPIIGIELAWELADARWYDIEPQLRALSSARTSCPVGSGVSSTTVTLHGAATSVVDPEVIVRGPNGEELSRLTLSGSLTTNRALVIDSARASLALYDAGTLQAGTSSGDSWLVSGEFPLLSGEDGESVTMELSSASGTPTGVALYRRTW